MKISFDSIPTNLSAEPTNNHTYSSTQAGKMPANCGFAVDISGKVMDNNAYGQGRTAEEVMQQLGAVDVATMRDYLTVMSHSMSAEDFHKMQEEGFDPANMDMAQSTTIIDHIKAALIKGGTVIEGYTTDMDTKLLQDITGSASMAQALEKELEKADISFDKGQQDEARKAVEKAKSLGELSEAAVKYMVTNQTPVSIDGMYQASHCAYGDGNRQGHGFYAEGGISGYYAKKAEEIDLKALEPQMKKVIEQAQLPVSEQTLAQAGWLLEKGLPLTKEYLVRLHQIQSVEMPLSDTLIAKAVTAALVDGKEAGAGNLADPRSMIQKAQDITLEVQSFGEQEVEQVVAKGQTFSIANLRAMYAAREQQDAVTISQSQSMLSSLEVSNESDYALQAKAVLYRTQLMMTTSANLKLLQSGYAIDTAPLEKVLEQIEQAIETEKKTYWNTEDLEVADTRQALYEETTQIMSAFSSMPAAAMIPFAQEPGEATVLALHEEGAKLAQQYKAANLSYETMMSTPRADLGDSIKKAFANVDDILMDMELEVHEMNRRAVRILGYNSMDITPELLQAVKMMDSQIQNIMNRMTPAVTLETIREGVNPLEMSVSELNEYLDSLPKEEEKSGESLGKFLHALEQKKDITAEEKEACIGIYRIFRQIEKKDHAVVGQLVRNGQEPSFKNVLEAIRSAKKKGMDYTVDDAFSGVDGKITGPSITEQIEGAFYKEISRQVALQATPEQMLHAMEKHEMTSMVQVEASPTTIEQMASSILYEESYLEDKKESLKRYEEAELAGLREDAVISNETLGQILSLDIPATPAYVKAFDQLMAHPGEWQQQFSKWHEKKEKELAIEEPVYSKEKAENVIEQMLGEMENGQEENAILQYEELNQIIDQTFTKMEELADGYLDLKSLQSYHRQMSVAASLRNHGQWNVPMTIQNEDTLIHLTLRQEAQEKGQVDIFFETEDMGKVAARLSVGKSGRGYVLAETTKAVEYLEKLQGRLGEVLGGDIDILQTEQIPTKELLALQKMEDTSDNNSVAVTTKQLYQVAARFIKVIQG